MISGLLESSPSVPAMAVSLPTIIVLGLAALAAVVIIWRLISALTSFRADLLRHQQEDCTRLDELAHQQTAQLQLSTDIKEAIQSIDKTITLKYDELVATHLRHQQRNDENVRHLQEEVNNLGKQQAVLEATIGPEKHKPLKRAR